MLANVSENNMCCHVIYSKWIIILFLMWTYKNVFKSIGHRTSCFARIFFFRLDADISQYTLFSVIAFQRIGHETKD